MKKRGIVMSNEIGNLLYRNAIKYIQEMCKKHGNLEAKQLADYIVDKIPLTAIYNVTDAAIKMQSVANAKKSLDDAMQTLDITYTPETSVSQNEVGGTYCDTLNMQYPIFNDNVFVYFKFDRNLLKGYAGGEDIYLLLLLHRLDDDRIVAFVGLGTHKDIIIIDSCPIRITIQGCEINLIHIIETMHAFAERQYGFLSDEEIANRARSGMEERLLDIAIIFKIFQDISNQNKREFKCYVDKEEQSKPVYFRKITGNRGTIKVNDKPVILVLRDDKDIESKINKYRNPRGYIEYAFSWVVHGHYRRLHNPETMGYNRSGEKVMQGMTWVETYLKGDTNLPLLKRETIVIDKRSKNGQG